MRPEIQFILCCMGVSLVSSYAWWCRFRVWSLRQDLFAIRDRLWLDMHNAGSLDDPDHRAAREAINAMIRIAPVLSVLTVIRVLFERPEGEMVALHTDEPVVRSALNKAFGRVVRFILLESLSGLLLMIFVGFIALIVSVPMNLARSRLAEAVGKAINSGQVRESADDLPESVLAGSI